MITAVVMPQMGLEVTSGIVAAVHVAPGAHVAEGDALLELETDKALTDVVAPHDGIVRAVEVEVGDTVPLGATLVLVAGAGEDAEVPEPVAVGAGTAEAEDEAAESSQTGPAAARTADGRLRAARVAVVG